MKPLEKKYNKNGFAYELVDRQGDVAIYSQTLPETGKIIAYEVFEVMKNKEREIAGKIIGAGESVPNIKQWGAYAFTVYDLEAAKLKQGFLSTRILERKKQPRGVV